MRAPLRALVLGLAACGAQAGVDKSCVGSSDVCAVGASLPNALYQETTFAYSFSASATVTYKATGSTTGKDSIIANTVNFAGSDSLLSDEQYGATPDLQMYPAVAAAIVPVYNLPSLGSSTTLVLSRETLPRIFLGDIRSWADPEIQKLNPGIELPDRHIRVVVRDDGSGTSEAFTSSLSLFSDDFNARIGAGDVLDWCEDDMEKLSCPANESLGCPRADMYTDGVCCSNSAKRNCFGSKGECEGVSWALDSGYQSSGTVTCEKAAHAGLGPGNSSLQWNYTRGYKNSGVVAAVYAFEGSIGYAVLSDALSSGLKIAGMENQARAVVTADATSLASAVMELGGIFDEGGRNTASLFDAKSTMAWPIATYTYYVLRKGRESPSSTVDIMSASSPYAQLAVAAANGDMTLTQYEANFGCAIRELTFNYIDWYYNAEVASNIAERLGFALLPSFLGSTVLTGMFAENYCLDSDGSERLAVQVSEGNVKYFAMPPDVEAIINPYLDTYATVDSSVTWQAQFSASNQAWADFNSGANKIILVSRADVTVAQPATDRTAAMAPLFVVGVAPLVHVDGYPWTDGNGSHPLVLSLEVLAMIYLGEITQWNDANIQSLQPAGAPALPPRDIVVVTRSDSSDSTLTFTSQLARSYAPFRAAHGDGVRSLAQPGAPNAFPADSDTAADGSVTFFRGSIGMVALTYDTRVDIAALKATDGSGATVQLSLESLAACANDASARKTSDEVASGLYTWLDFSLLQSAECWPMATSYEVVVPHKLLHDECTDTGGITVQYELGFARWLFDGSTVISPFKNYEVQPVEGAVRAEMHSTLESRCVTCLDGSYLNEHTSQCEPCAAGFSRAITESQLRCTICPKGHFAPRGSGVCEACPAGYFANKPGMSECEPCSIDTYQPDTGATECQTCPANTQAQVRAAVAKTDCECKTGYYNLLAGEGRGKACAQCPLGAVCPGNTNPPIALEDWWASRDRPDLMLQCKVVGSPCPGGKPETCKEGYRGDMCSECVLDSPRYYRSTGKCERCNGSNIALASLAIPLLLVIALVLRAYANIDRQGPLMRSSVALSANVDNLIVFLQVFNLWLEVEATWPASVQSLMEAFSFLRLNLSVLSIECSIAMGFEENWRVGLFAPWFFIAVQFAVGLVMFVVNCLRRKTDDLYGAIYRSMNASLYVMGLLYLISASNTFQAFSCMDQPDGSRTMRVYPAIRCGSEEWRSNILPYAAFSTVITVLGYPLALSVVFAAGFSRYEKYSGFNRSTMIVTNPYKARYFWWDGVEAVRKLTLVIIIAFFDNAGTQLAISAMTILVIGCLHLRFRPYKHQNVNIVSGLCFFSLLLVLISGLGLHILAAEDTPTAEENVYVVVFIVIIYFACIVVLIMSMYVVVDSVHVLYRAQTEGHVMNRVTVDEELLQETLEMASQVPARGMINQVASGIDDEDMHAHFNETVNFLFAVASNNAGFQRTPKGTTLSNSGHKVRLEEHRPKGAAARGRELKEILQKSADSAVLPSRPNTPSRSTMSNRYSSHAGGKRANPLSRISMYGQTVPVQVPVQRSPLLKRMSQHVSSRSSPDASTAGASGRATGVDMGPSGEGLALTSGGSSGRYSSPGESSSATAGTAHN